MVRLKYHQIESTEDRANTVLKTIGHKYHRKAIVTFNQKIQKDNNVEIRKTNSVHHWAAMGATVGQMLWAVS